MRTLFLLLLLANLGFFAWMQFYGGDGAQRDPRPLQQQVAADQIRILSPREIGIAAPVKPAAQRPEPDTRACVEWGSFVVTDAPQAEKSLEPLALGARLTQRRAEEVAGWWVYFPAQGSRAGATKKAGELKARGIEDFFIVLEEGPWRWALSLGVFKTEEAAKGRLEALRAKGVRTALLGQRETQVQKVLFEVRGVDAALLARLRVVAETFPGSEIRDCASPAGGARSG
ncbi:MAG: SPOR domain-containing protein [Betaproteobacteria bacterium]|nr:SPOR domain-containing protein [Betaproteobacteria bacterium]